MAIDFACPKCGAAIEADEAVAGTTAHCPQCQGTMLIPKRGICAGTRIGHFTVERKLGAGGMGEVWLARQEPMHRSVALKILPPAMAGNQEFMGRFMQEVQLAAKLEHPHIVTAFDAGVEQDIIYLAMSFVDGEGLDARLEREKVIAEREALRIARGVAEALGYAWDRFKILHRDIKPANIMLTADGEPKLMDLGISKSMSEDVSLTMTGYIVGTPQYMSPEQARADEDEKLDFRSDVYSLGATLYHMVTGTLPFASKTAMGMLSKHISEPLESPRKRNPAVTESCAALIEAMMAKARDERQGSWQRVVEDIDRVAAGHMPTTMRPAAGKSVVMQIRPEELRKLRQAQAQRRSQPEPLRAAAPARKGMSPGLIAAAAVLVVAAAAGIVAMATRDKPPPAAPPVAAAPVKPDPAAEQAQQLAELWAHAERFAREQPGDPDQAIANFRTVKERTAGSKYEMMADAEIKRLETAKKTAASAAATKALDELKAKTLPLLEAQDYAGAADVYASYAGALADETAAQRKALADEYRAKAGEQAQARAAATDAARLKVDAALTATAGELLAGKTVEALAAWETLGKEPLPTAEQARVKQARDLVQGLAAADGLILKSFAEQAGQEIDLVIGGKLQRLKIVAAKGGAVQAERSLGQASVSANFTLRQVAAAEKCRRLQGQTTPEVYALYACLQAQTEQRGEDAIKAGAGAGILATPLAAALGGQQQVTREAQAEQALRATLRKAGVTGEALDWAAVSEQLGKAKPTAATVASVQQDLGAYGAAHGKTQFAAAQSNLIEQVAAYLAEAAKPAAPALTPKPVSTLSKRDDDAKPDKEEAAILRRVEEARLRTGPVIRVSPEGGNGTVTLEEGIKQLKSGMVLRLAGGRYPTSTASANGTYAINGLKGVVIEGEPGTGVVRTAISTALTFNGCDSAVVRSLIMPGASPSSTSGGSVTVVDCCLNRLWLGGDACGIAFNSVLQSICSYARFDAYWCTVSSIVLRPYSGAFPPSVIANSIVVAQSTPLGIAAETQLRLQWKRCLVYSEQADRLGILYEGDPLTTKELRSLPNLASLRPYVTGVDVGISPVRFVGAGLWPAEPGGLRLAPGSPGRGAGPGGRDLGAFIGPNGFPIPYPGEPGATRIKTAADLQAALKAANPGYKGDGKITAEKGQIMEVTIDGYHGSKVTDISPLQGLALRDLKLNYYFGAMSTFSPLAGMPLARLDLHNCSNFSDSDMPMLAAMPLDDLEISATKVTDLTALRGKQLSKLDIGSTAISDLEPLRGMPIAKIVVSSSRVTNIDALAGMPLTEFSAQKTQISNIGVLAGMPLRSVNIIDTLVSDLSPLRRCPLSKLSFTPRNIKNPADISMLRTMATLVRIVTDEQSLNQSSAEFWKRYDAGEFK